MEKNIGIFIVDGMVDKKNRGIIKYINSYNENNKMHSYDDIIRKINLENIIDNEKLKPYFWGFIFKPHITNDIIMNTLRLPIYRFNVRFDNEVDYYNILDMVLYFNIKQKVESEHELINNELDGHFELFMYANGKEIETKLNWDTYQDETKIFNHFLNIINNKEIRQLILNIYLVKSKKGKKIN